MECRLAGKTEVLGENLPQRHFYPSQNPTWPDPDLNPGHRGGKPATNRLSYGAAFPSVLHTRLWKAVSLNLPFQYSCWWRMEVQWISYEGSTSRISFYQPLQCFQKKRGEAGRTKGFGLDIAVPGLGIKIALTTLHCIGI
jgi:hypothetical protein